MWELASSCALESGRNFFIRVNHTNQINQCFSSYKCIHLALTNVYIRVCDYNPFHFHYIFNIFPTVKMTPQ